MSRGRRVVALLLTVLVVGSAVTVGVGATHDGPPGPDGQSSADEVYVSDDGDVVFVYNETQSDSEGADGQFGASVGENIVYANVSEPADESPETRGSFSAEARPTLVTASGNLSFPQPDQVRDFELDASSQATENDSRTDVDLSATFTEQGGIVQILESITTDGEVTVGPNRLQASGNFEARTTVPMGQEASASVTLRETSNGYTLSAEQNQVIGEFTVDRWRNRSVAERTIRQQYAPFSAQSMGIDTSVSLDRYSLERIAENQYRLDVAFTVEYRNVDRVLGQLVTAGLSSDPDISQDQAQQLAQELQTARINEISFSFDAGAGTYSGSFTLDLADYEGLVLAYLDIAESVGDEGMPLGTERARAQFEAQRAADLEQTLTWSGDLSSRDDGSLGLDVTVEQRTTNWEAYVSELQSRDVPWFDSSFSLTGASDGDRISLEGSLRAEGDRLFEGLFGQFEAQAAANPELSEFVQSLTSSQPQQLKVESSFGEDGTHIEAGAAFGNLSALRDTIASEAGAPHLSNVTEVVGRIDGNDQTTYVHASGAVGGDASESDVRALEPVGEDTTIHMPGDWDREFPSLDVASARAFLGLPVSDGGSGPGFGPVAAVLAIVAAALVAARRR